MLSGQSSNSSSGAWALSYHPVHAGSFQGRSLPDHSMASQPSYVPESTKNNPHTPWYRIPYVQILFALALGIGAGHLFPKEAASLKILGDFFTKLLRMMVAPIIFCTVVHGIGSMGNMRRLGRTGLRALLYFEVVSTLALVIGLVVVNLVKPGVGLNFDVRSLEPSVGQGLLTKTAAAGQKSLWLSIIPSTFFGAFASGELLQVLFVALIAALALPLLPGKGQSILHLIEDGGKLCMSMMGIIVKFAPLGAMAYTVGQFGIGSLGKLALLMLCFYATAALFVGVVLGAILRWAGGSLVRYLVHFKDEILLVLGTCSSETALPAMMRKLEALGCSRATVGLVVPTGFSFNLDGTNIYLTMAVVFLAQATNTPLDLSQQIALLVAALMTSKGSAAVAGAGFVTLAAIVQSVPGIPIESLAILVGKGRFMSECRSVTNLIGNGVAALAISKSEGELKDGMLKQGLAR